MFIMKSLYIIIAFLVTKVRMTTAGVCKMSSKVTSIPYSDTIVNHTIVGPVMSSITAVDERECEMECHLAVPDLCYMFNFHPSSKVCELLYKNRAAEYKVERKAGSTFKTRKCLSNPCLSVEQCVSLGNQSSNICVEASYNPIQVNVDPVCTGSKDNSYGTFFAPADGKIKTFKLIHISGGVSIDGSKREANWGSLTSKGATRGIELHITDDRNLIITPPPRYPVNMNHGLMLYDVAGFNNMSPKLIFPEISPHLLVTKGKEFRIWFGQDLQDYGEGNNSGTTCADVYIYYAI